MNIELEYLVDLSSVSPHIWGVFTTMFICLFVNSMQIDQCKYHLNLFLVDLYILGTKWHVYSLISMTPIYQVYSAISQDIVQYRVYNFANQHITRYPMFKMMSCMHMFRWLPLYAHTGIEICRAYTHCDAHLSIVYLLKVENTGVDTK